FVLLRRRRSGRCRRPGRQRAGERLARRGRVVGAARRPRAPQPRGGRQDAARRPRRRRAPRAGPRLEAARRRRDRARAHGAPRSHRPGGARGRHLGGRRRGRSRRAGGPRPAGPARRPPRRRRRPARRSRPAAAARADLAGSARRGPGCRSGARGRPARWSAVSLEVGIVGLPNAGKTPLFNALTRAGAEITAYASVTEKPNVGMATIADDRLDRLAALVQARKVTPAAVRVVDVPGTGPQLLGNLRQVDALLVVVDGFSADADPAADLETLQLELLVADRDHVERRLERVRKEAKSGEQAKRREVEELEAVLAHLESGRSLAEWRGELPAALEPLTTKPLLSIENGPGGIDLKLEAELAELPDEEAAAFREGPSALEEVVRRLQDALGLITFFTAGEK